MTPATKTMFSTLMNVQQVQRRRFGQAGGAARFFFINATYGRGTGLGRGLSVGVTLGARVGVGVAVAGTVAVGVGVAVFVAVAVGVGAGKQNSSIELSGVTPSLAYPPAT